jgi:hypothetical protein
MKIPSFIIFFILIYCFPLFSQEEPDTSAVIQEEEISEFESDPTYSETMDSVGVYVIESYLKEEEKKEIVVYFFATSPVKARIIFDGGKEFIVSDTLAESFRFTSDFSVFETATEVLRGRIFVEDEAGNKSSSEEFEIPLPVEPKIEGTALGYLADCTLGALAYLVPSPGLSFFKDETRFSFFKEIPVVVFQSNISDLPWMALAAEYVHTPDIDFKNRFFFGVKFPFEVPVLKYAAPGISFSTNFLGINGISPEVSVAFFEIFRVINFNIKARYNYYPSATGLNHFDINIGLTSYFLTFAL